MCPMGQSRKAYTRVGDYVEVRLPKIASYGSVAAHAFEVMQVEEEDEEEGGEPRIFRIDGTVVPSCAIWPWNIVGAPSQNAVGVP